MIYTGNYSNCKNGNIISISGNKGIDAGFNGKYCKELAPKYIFWKEWHDLEGMISEEERTKFYIEHYYNEVLKNIDINSLINSLGENPILLCYESPEKFCHRHIVAFYLETLGYETKEIMIDNKENISYLERPEYIKEILLNIINSEEYKITLRKAKDNV